MLRSLDELHDYTTWVVRYLIVDRSVSVKLTRHAVKEARAGYRA